MQSPRDILVFGLLALVSTAPARGAAMQSYSVTDLGVNQFSGLNDLGQAIGQAGPSYSDASSRDQLLYTAGKIENLGQSIRLLQTNGAGKMIAELPGGQGFGDSSNTNYAIRNSDGSTGPLAGLMAHEVPIAINDRGQILVSGPNPTPGSLTILTDGTRQQINLADYSAPFRVTAFGPEGQVAGLIQIVGQDHSQQYLPNGQFGGGGPDPGKYAVVAFNNIGGFITQGGGYYPSGWASPQLPASLTSPLLSPLALNDKGQVVGTISTLSPYSYTAAAVLQDGSAKDLNTLLSGKFDGHLDIAFKVNNLGQILATGTVDGSTHSFLLTPQSVPEPSTWLIAVTLIGGAAVRLRVRRAC